MMAMAMAAAALETAAAAAAAEVPMAVAAAATAEGMRRMTAGCGRRNPCNRIPTCNLCTKGGRAEEE